MPTTANVQLVECPRDAMQGLHDFIPTEKKAAYLNQLLKVGFHTLDFGSFVSARAIPQMRDTADVLKLLDRGNSPTKLLAIVANERGAEEALAHPQIDCLGFPLSLSETFQQRNTNKSIAEAIGTVKTIQERCRQENRLLVTYISMAFGNPYGDEYSTEGVKRFLQILQEAGVGIVSLSDTIGSATEDQIKALYQQSLMHFPDLELGLHLHSRYDSVYGKTKAAWEAGCRRIDGALRGFGGCPMAKEELVGNMATEEMIRALDDLGVTPELNREALQASMELTNEVFPAAAC